MKNKVFSEVAIKNYLDGNSDFSDVYLIGSKTDILKELKKFVEIYPERKSEIEYVVENLDELLKSKYEFRNLIKILYIKSKYPGNNYGWDELAYNLLILSEKDAIELIRKQHITKQAYSSFIRKFKTKFPKQLEEIEVLKGLYVKYLEKYNIDPDKKVKRSYIECNHVGDKRLDKFVAVYESGYCIEEYCSINGETIHSVTTAVKNLKLEDKQKYAEEYEEILNRDNSDFYEYIRFTISKLLEIDKNDFTIMDYHKYTKLPVTDFVKLANSLVENQETIKELLIMIKIADRKLPRICKDVELNSKITINGVEVSREDKENVFNYLEENGYPICDYKIALRKYLNGTLIVDKKLELKK